MSSTDNNNNNNNSSTVEETQNQQNQQQTIDQGTGQAENTQPVVGQQQGQDKPTFEQFQQLQQQQQQPASQTVGVTYDQNGNAVFPQIDTIGNDNRSRGIIGTVPQGQGQNNQQQQQQPQATKYPGTSGASQWDKVNPPTVFPQGQQQPQVQKINPTSPEELNNLIKEQQDQTRLNQEASGERMKMYRMEMQGEYYTPPQHLENHPYLAGRLRKPAEIQAQNQTTQQKLDQGEAVISITDEQPTTGQQQQQQNQPIQPNQIKNGIENLIPQQQEQENNQQ
jgi:hypothetical protein